MSEKSLLLARGSDSAVVLSGGSFNIVAVVDQYVNSAVSVAPRVVVLKL